MDKKRIYNILTDNSILSEVGDFLSNDKNYPQRLELILEWLSFFRKPLEIYQYARVNVSAYYRPETLFVKDKYFEIVVQIRAFRIEDDYEEFIKDIRTSYFKKNWFIEDLEILTEASLIFPLAFKELQKHSAESQKNK